METSTLLYLNKKDIAEINFSMSEIIEALELMFKDKGEGKVEMPPKPGIHTRKDAFIHAMPAYIPSMKSAGMKWISGYPENQQKGLPYINGLLILNDPETGIPMAIMDATWITAKRTGAATALAAKYLARKESNTVGILACGVQGRSNLEALCCLFDIKKVKAYDLTQTVAQQFSKEMSEQFELEIEVVNSPKEAVNDLDIVVTSGPILKKPQPVIQADWLKEGAFASPVDFDSYWQGAAIQQVDKLVTDDINQLNYYRKSGYFSETPQPYADLGDIVSGKLSGRESDHERTMCINLGLALDDMATAILVYQKALKKQIGTYLEL